MNDQQIEKEIVAKGKTSPRVTPQHIDSIICYEMYFTAYDGFAGSAAENPDAVYAPIEVLNSAKLLTFCVLTLENGFTVTGESACASPENFDAEIGRKIARQNAVNKIWMLEGYLLKQRLHDDRSDVWENEDDCRRALTD
ncbi:Gp49 family protein [Salmonella enterica subsp. enterica serovar Heidelberg]